MAFFICHQYWLAAEDNVGCSGQQLIDGLKENLQCHMPIMSWWLSFAEQKNGHMCSDYSFERRRVMKWRAPIIVNVPASYL